MPQKHYADCFEIICFCHQPYCSPGNQGLAKPCKEPRVSQVGRWITGESREASLPLEPVLSTILQFSGPLFQLTLLYHAPFLLPYLPQPEAIPPLWLKGKPKIV